MVGVAFIAYYIMNRLGLTPASGSNFIREQLVEKSDISANQDRSCRCSCVSAAFKAFKFGVFFSSTFIWIKKPKFSFRPFLLFRILLFHFLFFPLRSNSFSSLSLYVSPLLPLLWNEQTVVCGRENNYQSRSQSPSDTASPLLSCFLLEACNFKGGP